MQSLNKRKHQQNCTVTSNLLLPQICAIEFFQEVFYSSFDIRPRFRWEFRPTYQAIGPTSSSFRKSQTIDMGLQALVFYVNWNYTMHHTLEVQIIFVKTEL